jgi:hypothetical protein
VLVGPGSGGAGDLSVVPTGACCWKRILDELVYGICLGLTGGLLVPCCRLQNACQQRDDARSEVVILQKVRPPSLLLPGSAAQPLGHHPPMHHPT